jgi:hypothetical protein
VDSNRERMRLLPSNEFPEVSHDAIMAQRTFNAIIKPFPVSPSKRLD